MEQNAFSAPGCSSLKILILSVSIAMFLLPCMVIGVSPALPFIGRSFNASAMDLSLVNAVYALALAIFNLLASRIGDIFGRRKIFLFGLSIFIVVSGLLPFSPTILTFLVLRFVQAVGAALMNTCALAILVACSPKEQLGQVLGISSIGIYLGISFGPAIAGFMITFLGWSYLFFSMVPIGIIAWFMMAFTVRGEWKEGIDESFDWKGAFFYTLGIVMLSAGTIWILKGIWAVIFFTVGLSSLGCFFWVEKGKEYPILDVEFMIGNKPFLLSALAAFINYSLIFGIAFYLSLYLQISYGLNVLQTGLMLSFQPIIQVIGSPIAGRVADKYGAAKISMIGMVFCGVGLLFATGLDADTDFLEIVYIQILLGIGVALFSSPNNAAIMSCVDSKHISQASGIVGTMRTLGLLLSMVIISLTMYIYLGKEALKKETIHSFLEAMHMNFSLFGVINIVAIFLAYWSLRSRKGHTYEFQR